MDYVAGPLPEKMLVSGVSVELLRKGSGQPLLFLHGGEGVDPNAEFIEALSRRFSVIAVSHPGFGLSDLPDHYSHIDDLAYFYLDLIAQLELHDVILVGASFGGWLAAEIAIKTDALAGLVMIDALGIKVGPRDERDFVDIFSQTRATLNELSFGDPERGFGNPKTPDEFLVAARNRDALSLYGWLPYMHNPKLKRRLHRVTVPTLFVWGGKDKIAEPAYGCAYAGEIPGARFSLIEEAGHYPHVETPQRLLEQVLGFTATVSHSNLEPAK